jgi:hypothetical protein
MRCWVYVDGFNFYHGACCRVGCKWIDLRALSQQLRPNDTIERIKYFTALVERRTDDPDQRRRQRLYWRALDTLGIVERIEGKFTRHGRSMPLCCSVEALELREQMGQNVAGRKPEMVRVMRSDEKGSDVNLAVHLVHDAHLSGCATFEVALVLSSDADLAGAIRIVTRDLGKHVYVCRPDPANRTRALDSAATGIFDLSRRTMLASQFPAGLSDADGQFSPPRGW